MHYPTVAIFDHRPENPEIEELIAQICSECDDGLKEFSCEVPAELVEAKAREAVRSAFVGGGDSNASDLQIMLADERYGDILNECYSYVPESKDADSDFGYIDNPNAICDWGLRGGRFSGKFSMAKYDKKKVADYMKDFKNQKLHYCTSTAELNKRDKIDKELMAKHFPGLDVVPFYSRDGMGATECYDDDMVCVKDLTPKELKRILDTEYWVVRADTLESTEIDGANAASIKTVIDSLDKDDYLVQLDLHD